MKNVAFDNELFEQTVRSMPQDALASVRSDAASEFARAGFPTVRDEDWRYTDLSAAVSLSNDWMAGLPQSATDDFAVEADVVSKVDAHWICLHNGRTDIGEMPHGVSIQRLSDCTSPASVATDSALSLFNAALLTEALEITVSAGTELEKPIGILFFDKTADTVSVSQHRIILKVEENAAAGFIEAHASGGKAAHYGNGVIQIELAAASDVSYVRLQQRARHHIYTGKLAATIDDGASLKHCGFDLGGRLIRNDIEIRLQGREASVTLDGLYLAGNDQHIDNHTRVDHEVGPSRSEEQYRGVLNRKAHCVFNGKAIVHKGADGSDAQQANHNLLLSESAEVDTKPELEIYADDVKCSHGATVGQLDANALFYLRTRGLDHDQATHIMTRAFAAEVVGSISVPQIAELTTAAVDSRLDTLIGDQPDD